MTPTERKRETRRQNALDRLGTNNPICSTCEESDPHCLEMHHIAGRKFDSQLVPVCRNCHRKLSNAQKEHPVVRSAMEVPATELIGRYLLGLADLFKMVSERLHQFGLMLLAIQAPNQEVSK